MLQKFYFLLLFISHFLAVNAQTAKKENVEKKILFWSENIGQQENLTKDTLALKKYLQPLLKQNSDSDQILYALFLANGSANAHDKINRNSNKYFSAALKISEKIKNKPLQIWSLLAYAEYLYKYRRMTEAIPVFVSAIEKIKQVSPSEIIFPAESYTNIGFYMGTVGDNDEAINYLEKALKYTKRDSEEFARIADNLGAYYFKNGDLKNGRYFIEEASKAAKQNKNWVRYAKTLGNLALFSEQSKDFKTAINLISEDIKISEKYNSEQNTMFAYTLLGRFYIADQQLTNAAVALEKADAIAKSRSYYKINELEILKLKLELITEQNTGGDELMVRRRIEVLQDSLNKTDGVLPLNQANWMMQKRKYQENIALTNKNLAREFLLKKVFLTISGIVILVLAFLFYRSRLKIKRGEGENAKMIREYEEAKFETEKKLREAQNSFDAQFVFLKEKNNQIQSLYAEIEKIKNPRNIENSQDRSKIDDLLHSHLMTEENWINFKMEFLKEYPSFYKNLTKGFPEITESNLRIIFLQKLGFNNTEIAGLLGITLEAVKKSKQRLKRKLGDKHGQLFEMIFSEN